MQLLLTLLLLLQLEPQLAPPTQSIKKRHGDTVNVAWDLQDDINSTGLLFFSIKATSNISGTPVEFKQVPKTERQTNFVVVFSKQDPKYVYYVITAVYDGTKGESFPSNTIMVERVGAPPTE